MNFLESLAAEWYGYNGYFVRSNVRVLPLKHGGFGGELDVLAYSPKDSEFIHIETSSDALVSSEREKRMRRKFNLPHGEYEKAFNVKVDKVRKIAICGSSYKSDGIRWGDIEVMTVQEFVRDITETLSQKEYLRAAVPESYPLLRAIQMSTWATKKPRVGRKH